MKIQEKRKLSRNLSKKAEEQKIVKRKDQIVKINGHIDKCL